MSLLNVRNGFNVGPSSSSFFFLQLETLSAILFVVEIVVVPTLIFTYQVPVVALELQIDIYLYQVSPAWWQARLGQ